MAISGISFINALTAPAINPVYTYPVQRVGKVNAIDGSEGTSSTGKVSPAECETCKNRKYVDGSNEGDVSFKTPGHIDPAESAAVVKSHEMEHVANARQKTASDDAELVSCSVRLQTAVCPECGTSYVSGGLTSTTIKYSNATPYDSARKSQDYSLLAGMNIDASA